MGNKIELKKGDTVYYLGIGWGSKTHIFNIHEEDGVKIIHANNGVKRKYDDVVNNGSQLHVCCVKTQNHLSV